jgi:hypothetical protein
MHWASLSHSTSWNDAEWRTRSILSFYAAGHPTSPASILLLQITGNQMFGDGYPLVAQHSDYGSYSQFVEELNYRDTLTHSSATFLFGTWEGWKAFIYATNWQETEFCLISLYQLVLLYKFSSNICIDSTAKDSFPETNSRQSYKKQWFSNFHHQFPCKLICQNASAHARPVGLTTRLLEILVFWHVMPCRLVDTDVSDCTALTFWVKQFNRNRVLLL